MIGIYVNLMKDSGALNARKFIKILESLNANYALVNEVDGLESVTLESVVDSLEMIVVFGGDGTILQVNKLLGAHSIPILGINTGRLGFLAEINVSEMESLAFAIVKGEYSIEERFTLAANIDGKTYYAVNDVALTRGASTRTLRVEINIDGEYTDEVLGDGMLVSTPTGSTAYALSCGGPILCPTLNVMSVVAICPHTLHSRPMVVSNNSVVELIADNSDGHLMLSVDSEAVAKCVLGTMRVVVTKSDRTVKFVRIKQENFYNRLLNKLNCWNREK